jgi:hypothetical protein
LFALPAELVERVLVGGIGEREAASENPAMADADLARVEADRDDRSLPSADLDPPPTSRELSE